MTQKSGFVSSGSNLPGSQAPCDTLYTSTFVTFPSGTDMAGFSVSSPTMASPTTASMIPATASLSTAAGVYEATIGVRATAPGTDCATAVTSSFGADAGGLNVSLDIWLGSCSNGRPRRCGSETPTGKSFQLLLPSDLTNSMTQKPGFVSSGSSLPGSQAPCDTL